MSFDTNGNYNKTTWKSGDKITAEKLNKIEDALGTINDKINWIDVSGDEIDLSNYATKEDVDNKIEDVLETIDENDKHAHEEINNRLDELEEKNEIIEEELNNKADKEHTHDGYLTEHQDISHLATKEELNQGKADMETMVAEVEGDLDNINDIMSNLSRGKLPIKDSLKGTSVYLPMPGGQPSFDEILDKLVYANCNTITICPIFWMNSSNTNEINSFKGGISYSDIKNYFVKAKEKGLNTILKPHVGGDGFSSWSSIQPTDVTMWITNYSNFYISLVDEIVDYIDIFCITNELKGQTSQFKELWEQLISNLKSIKNIPVICALTITEASSSVFLDKLDYIGFNMYCPVEGDLSTHFDTQLKSIFSLSTYINDMYATMNKYNKQAIITEVGILPFEISLRNPEAWGFEVEPPISYETQQRYYNIAVKEFLYASDIKGVMVWNACDGFTFINRPAQETLKEIFGGAK